MNFIYNKLEEYKLEFENRKYEYGKTSRKEIDKRLDKKFRELEISKELQNLKKDVLLVSYDFNSLYPSVEIDFKSTWPKIQTTYPLKNCMSDAFCSLFNSDQLKDLKKYAFLTVKYHNPENLIFQNLPITEKIKNPYKNKRFEPINRMRNGKKLDILTSVDVVEIVKCGGKILERYEGFFRHNLDYNPYSGIVTDLFEKRDSIKTQGKDLLQKLAKKIGLSFNGSNIQKHINEKYKCVTETWMRENFGDRV